MHLDGDVTIHAPRKKVWDFLTDPNLIAQYGILPTPALIINGKMISSGRVPSKPMIKKWLEEDKKRGK